MVRGHANNDDLAQFEESLSNFEEYPHNLVRTADFSYTLEAYHSRLEDEDTYFDSRRPRIRTWDLIEPQDTSHVRGTLESMDELRDALSANPTDPCRRFIFIQSASSRAALDCTREMMTYLFTYHQIMAGFLEFTSTFKHREAPHTFTSFRNENYLDSKDRQTGMSVMGRSGVRIQHCFNLLGIERGRGSKEWLQRQTAAYHSFDLVQGSSAWIILKGDATMRKRIESTTEESARRGMHSLTKIPGSFSQALKDHLLVMQWCAENWDSYTEALEAEYRAFSGTAEHAPVDEMARDIAANKKGDKISRSHPGQQISRSNTAPEAPTAMRRISMKVMTGLSTATQNEEPPARRVEHHRIEDLVHFDRFQNLNCLDTKLNEAIAAIDQNRRVLSEIKEHYRHLVDSAAFKLHVPEKSALKACKQAASEFVMKIGRLEGDLDNYKGNLKTVLRGVERTKSMYNGILQYQSMWTAEYFSTSSERSAEIMQDWTADMHEKTMSMHVITVFTLIFLPGTFVATIFSSGILTFGQEGEGGFGSGMGDWKVRLAGLKLYAAICFPLLALTLLAWLLAYCSARLRSESQRRSRQGGREIVLKEKGDDIV
ncbi:hypothetical protein ACJ41O_008463 [Fusarium nematophilum]